MGTTDPNDGEDGRGGYCDGLEAQMASGRLRPFKPHVRHRRGAHPNDTATHMPMSTETRRSKGWTTTKQGMDDDDARDEPQIDGYFRRPRPGGGTDFLLFFFSIEIFAQ